jgi:hypothetical protein
MNINVRGYDLENTFRIIKLKSFGDEKHSKKTLKRKVEIFVKNFKIIIKFEFIFGFEFKSYR